MLETIVAEQRQERLLFKAENGQEKPAALGAVGLALSIDRQETETIAQWQQLQYSGEFQQMRSVFESEPHDDNQSSKWTRIRSSSRRRWKGVKMRTKSEQFSDIITETKKTRKLHGQTREDFRIRMMPNKSGRVKRPGQSSSRQISANRKSFSWPSIALSLCLLLVGGAIVMKSSSASPASTMTTTTTTTSSQLPLSNDETTQEVNHLNQIYQQQRETALKSKSLRFFFSSHQSSIFGLSSSSSSIRGDLFGANKLNFNSNNKKPLMINDNSNERRLRSAQTDQEAAETSEIVPGIGSISNDSSEQGNNNRHNNNNNNNNKTSLQEVVGFPSLEAQGNAGGAGQQASNQISAAINKTRQQHLQLFEQQRRTLMLLKQKYMTNRAINDKAYYILLLIYSLFIIFGTISNSLICLTVILKPKILSPRNIFIVNLAGSDLLLCVFTMPFSFIEISMKMWQMGLLPCKLVAGLQATSIFVSTISITAIALDRYRVIVYPTHQESSNNTRSAVLLLALVWFVALLLSLPLFYFRKVEHLDINIMPGRFDVEHNSLKSIDFCVEAWPFNHGRGIYSVMSMIFQYVLPITIVSVVYAKISDKLQKRLIRRQQLTQLECQQKKQLNLIKRTHTMLVSVSLIFGLSWLPLNLLNLIGDFSDLFGGDEQSFRIVFAICHLIGCSSACSNPVLYGYLNENFRKEFRQVYAHHMHRIMRFFRRTICARLFCGRNNLEISSYMASTSSFCSSSSSWTSSSNSGTSSTRSSKSSPSSSSSAAYNSANSQQLISKTNHNDTEADGCRVLTRENSRKTNWSTNIQNKDLPPLSTPTQLADGKMSPNQQSIRKLSFQTLTSSRQKLDRTMRLCLCLSTMGSEDSLDQARPVSLRRNTLRSRALELSQSQHNKSRNHHHHHHHLHLHQHHRKRKRPHKSCSSKANVDLQTISRKDGSIPNGAPTTNTSNRRSTRRSGSRKRCQCECHNRDKSTCQTYKTSRRRDSTKLVDGGTGSCTRRKSLLEISQISGRRVWLRFFPSSGERFCRVSGSTSTATRTATSNQVNKSKQQISQELVEAASATVVSKEQRELFSGKESTTTYSRSRSKRHCSKCEHSSTRPSKGHRKEPKSAPAAGKTIGQLDAAQFSGATELRDPKSIRPVSLLRNSASRSGVGGSGGDSKPNGSPAFPVSGLTEGLRLASADGEDEDFEDGGIVGGRASRASGLSMTTSSNNNPKSNSSGRTPNSSSSSRSGRGSIITGKYYLSVETCRRKESVEQSTSMSRERTSTSVVFMNCDDSTITNDEGQELSNNQPNGLADGNGDVEINFPSGSGANNSSEVSHKTEIVSPESTQMTTPTTTNPADNIYQKQITSSSGGISSHLEVSQQNKDAQVSCPQIGDGPDKPPTLDVHRDQLIEPAVGEVENVGQHGDKFEKRSTNNCSSASGLSVSSGSSACLNSSCSCSLIHSSASSSISCQLNENDNQRPRLISNQDCTSPAPTYRAQIQALEKPHLVSGSKSASPLGMTSTTPTTVEGVVICSQQDCRKQTKTIKTTSVTATTTTTTSTTTTANSISRRSSLDSEFVCSGSSSSSLRKSCASLDANKETMLLAANTTTGSKNNNNDANSFRATQSSSSKPAQSSVARGQLGYRKLSVTASEDITVNKICGSGSEQSLPLADKHHHHHHQQQQQQQQQHNALIHDNNNYQ